MYSSNEVPSANKNTIGGLFGLICVSVIGLSSLYAGFLSLRDGEDALWFLVFGVIGVLGAGLGLRGRYIDSQDDKALKMVMANRHRFTEVTNFDVMPAKEPYITGKVVTVVDKDGYNEIINWFLELDRRLIPTAAEEVGTVLNICPKHRHAGNFAYATAAIAVDCTVEIMDLKRRAIIGRIIVPGTLPKEIKTNDGQNLPAEIYGWPSFSDFANAINKLPRN